MSEPIGCPEIDEADWQQSCQEKEQMLDFLKGHHELDKITGCHTVLIMAEKLGLKDEYQQWLKTEKELK